MDYSEIKNRCVSWIRDWFDRNGKDCCAVLGMSGGKDSTVAAALCAEALGRDRVVGVAMPAEGQSLNDADEICRWLGIRYVCVPIGDIINSFSILASCKVSAQGAEYIGTNAPVAETLQSAEAEYIRTNAPVAETLQSAEAEYIRANAPFAETLQSAETQGPELSGCRPSVMAALSRNIFAPGTEGLHPEQTEAVTLSKQAEQNIPPRVRMTVLYAVSQSLNGRVVNTCNLSEDWVGYATRWGDSVGDFSPLGGLVVQEIRGIGHELGIPSKWVDKTPDDGLPHSCSDEQKFGFTYEVLDRYIRTGECDDAAVKEKIDGMHRRNLFKLSMPESFNPWGK